MATQSGNTNYAAATPVIHSFTVNPGPQTITFAPLSDTVFSAAVIPITASTSSRLPVTFASATITVCTVAGSSVTLVSAGICSIAALQSGNANYAVAAPVTRSFTVNPGPQTITFAPLSAVTLPSPGFVASASASSGLAVRFSSKTTATCTVTSPATVVPLQAGTCSVAASQPGNTDYTAASDVIQSFTISAASSGGGSGGGGGGGGGGGSPLTLSSDALTINVTTGGAPGTQTVTISYSTYTQGAPTFTANSTTNQGSGWLAVSPGSGTMTQTSFAGFLYTYQGTVNVNADPTGLTPGGTYTGNINFSAGGGTTSLPVTLNITAQPAHYTVVPQSLTFGYAQGDSTLPPMQSISVFSRPSGGGFSVSSNAGWLAAGVTSGTAVDSIPVSVDVTKLGAGTFNGKITVAAGTAISIDVPVTITITKAAPQLTVSPQPRMFSLSQSGVAASGQIVVGNSGGGSVQYSAQAAADQGNWLRLTSPGTGSATASSALTLSFAVDPAGLAAGFYTGHITISDKNSPAQVVVPVMLALSKASPFLQLSQNGLSFSAVAGGPQPQSQSFTVANSGTGSMNWTIQTQVIPNPLANSNWLSANSNASVVSIAANTVGLPPGQYFGSINVSSPDALNGPQTVTVALNVLPSTSGSGVVASTSGLLFTGVAGNKTPAQQTVTFFNPSPAGIDYTASTLTANASGWLSVSTAAGTMNPGSNALQVGVDLSTLPVGVQTGSIRLAFSDGSNALIQVGVVATTVASPQSNSSSLLGRAWATPSTCSGGKPSFLVPVIRQPLTQSASSLVTPAAAAPTTVRAQVVDDCGAFVTAKNGGTVQATFSGNGSANDPTLDLHDIGAGVWEAAWTPVNAAAQVTLRVTASEPGLTVNPSLGFLATVTVPVQAAGSGSAPQPGGVINAASGGQGTPRVVAPGSYIAIYGSAMASGPNPSATSLPLPTTLNGTQVFLGGKPMPLVYAGPGQVNALVPQGLTPNASYPLVVIRGSTQSVPVPITVVEVQPGIYTLDLSGSGQGIVEIAGTATLAGPQGNGSRPASSGSDYLVIFCTGLGAVAGPNGEAPAPDGFPAPSDLIFHTVADVSVSVGGVPIPVAFAGLTPSLAGLYQVNVQLPPGLAVGDGIPMLIKARNPNSGAVAVSNTITVSLQ